MKDLVKDMMLNEIEIPKIHGEVDIRLKNPMTGRVVKQIKGENTFMSANLAKGLRNLGIASSSMYNQQTTGYVVYEPWIDLVGGIMLFKNSLSSAQYMTKGNKMQANGSYGVTNNANPPELGSWNSNESSASAGALLLVYDWTTSQANGAGGISSVALTGKVGGYIGYGNPSETNHSTKKLIYERQGYKSIQQLNGTAYTCKIQSANYQYQFLWSAETQKVTVRKTHVPITQASVFDWLVNTGAGGTDTEIDVSSLHYSSIYGAYGGAIAMYSGGDAYITGLNPYGVSIATSGKFYIWKYDIENDTITEIEMTNNTGEQITCYAVSVANGLVFVDALNKTHVFKLSDNEYIGYIENDSSGGRSGYSIGYEWANGLTIIPTITQSCIRIYDADNRTCYPTNGSFTPGQHAIYPYYDPSTDTLNYYSAVDNAAYVFNDPLYFATNYNLPSSVTKDSTMTMQVRYTLTEA